MKTTKVRQSTKSGKNKKGKILICRKSSCDKRGGKKLYRALGETLHKLGLKERISIEVTGCQKQCKKAPSLILMPGKVKHADVSPKDLGSLLKTHYQ
ncbi:NADH:ubiquinone oxidoreductase 24 kD subunit [Xenococcus sp. PCC 7305]|uniref:(2Fe-2S) ferredoxin domain-containing protein n=1 Tax=Xenococcus sp. PCC 7305 TaxID=102125 RepID=UPI0002AC70F2|nr:(2Fe-2S) ferredoxin domain-containing protein [Xenococcus sp. PCC 7305]ELS05187.1 NADH:ubiquinone oxidoreductase 24 kD subunit [Xenococcus sp. PCC 7305]